MILQDPQAIRHYQTITDGMVNLWRRRYLDGYIACLRNINLVEQYLIHRLEEQALNFLRDPSNFELAAPQTQMEVDTDYY
jgi:hypothetical protein